MDVGAFLEEVSKVYKAGNATEHSYRAPIQKFIASFDPELTVQNEPQRLQKVGAPDFSIHRDVVPVGYIEAKDLGVDLRPKKDRNKEQQDRYRKALPNLIYTDGLHWDFYRDGALINSVRIADLLMGVQPLPDQFATLVHALQDFLAQTPQTITSSEKLAEIMAGKAVLIKDILYNSLLIDKEEKTESELIGQYEAFKDQLIHDISLEDFADIYAETVAYGFFAARLHDPTLETFSRYEALELLPKSNPFLRNLFTYIAGTGLDERLAWIIDDFVKIFLATDLGKIMANFGKLTGRNDPFLHFYETFLSEYNPKKRKARGVWYTPEPVVEFIVRAVDEVLQSEFGLPLGLADTSKITVDWDTGQRAMTKSGKLTKDGKNATEKRELHRVQILDPATGTGTFLAEAIKQIAPKIKQVAAGHWSNYIEKDLIPRIHGFELLMASYAMCHLKLDMILTELGYQPTGAPPRLGVYLTNSLEEGEPADQTLPFAQWLSQEVKAANTIKRDMPIMVVIGNPPYSGESQNKSEWIMELMDAYKKESGGKEKLKERNPKWINDDYVKFMRMSEALINKNGEGVLGFITNHGYLDNLTFRGMRWHLMQSFDKIYVMDLHGNAKKKEVAPDGGRDENVFDIQQGVGIIIAVKTGKKKKGALGEVHHADLWGARNAKYAALEAADFSGFAKLEAPAPMHFFVPKDFELEAEYFKGFAISDLMPQNNVGIVTSRDAFVIDETQSNLKFRICDFFDSKNSAQDLITKYGIRENKSWKVDAVRQNSQFQGDVIETISYRPFDIRKIYYHDSMIERSRRETMRHFLAGENCANSRSIAHLFLANRSAHPSPE